jgi:hypothetical protein
MRVPTPDPIDAPPLVPQIRSQQTWRRRPNRLLETGVERPLKRARLTEENLRIFEKIGRGKEKGPKLEAPRSKKPSRSELNSSSFGTKSKSSTTTDPSFPRVAFENGILDPDHSTPHTNLGYHQDQLDRTRDTASPSESEYEDIAHRIRKAPNEITMVLVTSILFKGYGRGYSRVYNQAFSDFPKNVGFNDGLSAAQPDMVEGFEMTVFDPFPIRQELGGAAVPTAERDPPALPHLAGEWKGHGKDMILAENQAAYDSACMVHGRNAALSLLNRPDPTGHANVHTFTTDGTILNTFAHYSSEIQGKVKYHQIPTSSSLLISTYEDFKRSRRRLRNLQDEAKQNSEKLRDELKEKWLADHRSLRAPSETADSTGCDNCDFDEEDPTDQLLKEYKRSVSANNRDGASVQIPSANTVSTLPPTNWQETNQDDLSKQATDSALSSSLITPPQSSQSTSLPIKSSNDINISSMYSHGKTLRTKTRIADPAERLSRVNHSSSTLRKYIG